ncbi:vWA domain-containing protein [Dactylosporangium sp. NPDC049525]|uniref:vWA domain-containing protein n=1 Tax=Dactylosporangium sp. NPDC049525 TaxID=3154730 RepID=UPI0034246BF4
MLRLQRGPALLRQGRLAPYDTARRVALALLPLLLLAGLFTWFGTRPDPKPRPEALAPASPSASPSIAPSVAPSPSAAPTTSPPPPPPPSPAAPPSRIEGWKLPPGRTSSCIRLIVALDVSGSMGSYATYRDAALRQLLTWVPKNLKDTDQVAVVDFAGSVGVRQQPVRATKTLSPGAAASVSDGSLLQPLLEAAAAFPKTKCRTALVLLSDGQLNDLPASADDSKALLAANRVAHVRLLVPDPSIVVPADWSVALPNAAPRYFDGTDADATALAIGQTIADLVQQQLQVR